MFSLAGHLKKTVGEILDGMDAQELTHWMAMYELSPWGEERADLRNALLCAISANAWRGKNETPAKVEDFLPKYGQERKRERVIDLREGTLAERRERVREFSQGLAGVSDGNTDREVGRPTLSQFRPLSPGA